MVGRLLTKAALLLATAVVPVAMANEPGTDASKITKTTDSESAGASVGQPAKPAFPAKLKSETARNPRVVMITSKDSEACQRELERLSKADGIFVNMRAHGWKIGPGVENHIQIVDQNDARELVEQLDSIEFPIVACISDQEIVRSFKDGCSTPLDAWTFGWLIKGVSERPQAPIPEAIRVATTNNYPLRGNHWTVDGDTNPTKTTLVAHLRNPTHSPYLNASWKIEDWSTEELRSLHDDLHERYGPASPTVSAVGSGASSGPPNGIRKGLGK